MQLFCKMATDIIQAHDASSPSSYGRDSKTPVQTVLEDSGYVDPKEERAFVWRLDLGFLVIGFLGYMFKYIDQTNIVSGIELEKPSED